MAENKITGGEAIFIILICLFFDGIDFVATIMAIPTLGATEIAKLINNAIASTILLFWTTIKGIKPLWTLVGSALELIPVFNGLPFRTTAVIATIILHNRAITKATGIPLETNR